MSDCHHTIELATSGEVLSATAAIADLFLMGVSGSFLHCIGMCGPIAATQMSIRLMHLKSTQMQEHHKIKAAAATPYYLGKAVTYALLALVVSLFAEQLQMLPYAIYFSAILLILVAFGFVANIVNELSQICSKGYSVQLPTAPWSRALTVVLGGLKLANPFGLSGFFYGMILGLIPCGLLYSAIITAIAIAPSTIFAAVAMFAFGMGTIPGLFLLSYFGQGVLQNSRTAFRFLYIGIISINVVFLLSYSIKLLGIS